MCILFVQDTLLATAGRRFGSARPVAPLARLGRRPATPLSDPVQEIDLQRRLQPDLIGVTLFVPFVPYVAISERAVAGLGGQSADKSAPFAFFLLPSALVLKNTLIAGSGEEYEFDRRQSIANHHAHVPWTPRQMVEHCRRPDVAVGAACDSCQKVRPSTISSFYPRTERSDIGHAH